MRQRLEAKALQKVRSEDNKRGEKKEEEGKEGKHKQSGI